MFLRTFLADGAPAVLSSPEPNPQLWNWDSKIIPEPIRGSLGASMLGPQNVPVELENADLLAPPTTDSGDLPNMKWAFALSHNRLLNGGWARQQNVQSMPVATGLAGVNMRLNPGAVRELHWHNTAEWAYVLKGDVRISTVTPDGEVYIGDVTEGDIWYFPAGNPHSIQAKNTSEFGAEFLLVFDSGSFSEDDTFLLTDWLAHVPKSVLAQNFGESLHAFDHIPEKQLYIFPSSPPPVDVEADMVVPNNTPHPYTFALSKVTGATKPGGSIKVVDSRTFQVAQAISAVEVTVEVGGMRSWHPTEPEWSFFISGQGRVTVFAGASMAATYDFAAGDVGYIPPSFGHHVVNTGNTTLKFLEIFKSNLFQDISLTQWLALTPHELVQAHLGFSDETIAGLSRVKHEVV
ncbi:Bicupin oxalate decarboxylase oxidase [Mycena belliarum]|uniref:Bicupin oxalate decarboxylase oxidase n=1 Tax=Mycena belliarum TaxID=1033014 RepID=A0AAD6XW28_9AGAR|nr:Bicupin oxalate decarboxylase oxidase [Mycena belliae]